MQRKPASAFTLAERTAQWNLGYTGYFNPIQFTAAIMERWATAGGFDLDHSYVWLDGDAVVGFSYLGVRDGRGWIGGFGVAPDYRGRGLSYAMFAQHVAEMRQLGLSHVQLEVLTQNWARKIYERAGFAVTHTLAVLQGQLPTDATAPAGVQEGDPTALLAQHARLHAAAPACWQRTPAYLQAAPSSLPVRALQVGPADAPTGYLLYLVNDQGRGGIQDGAALDDATAEALVSALAARHPGTTMSLLNEPEGSPLHRALVRAGWATPNTQYEMHWQP